MNLFEVIIVLLVIGLLLTASFQQQQLIARVLVDSQINQLLFQFNTIKQLALLENRTYGVVFNPATSQESPSETQYKAYYLVRKETTDQPMAEAEIIFKEYFDRRLTLYSQGEVIDCENFSPVVFTGQGTSQANSFGFGYQGYYKEIVVNNRGRIYYR